jgi:predicted nucleic acid-binding protein
MAMPRMLRRSAYSKRLVAHSREFVVPELFFYELAAVLCRRLRQASDVVRALDRASRLGIRRFPFDARLIRRATRLAFDYGVTGYDACYAALAVELGAVWLTFDQAAAARLASLSVCRIPA